MRTRSRRVLLILFAALFVVSAVVAADLLTLNAVQLYQDKIRSLIIENYALSAGLFCLAFMSTAFFLPGGVVLTITPVFLYGVPLGTIYVVASGTLGCTGAFLLSRHVIGNWIQRRFERELKAVNREIERHGQNYLFTLRVLPLFPSFAINYGAGLTRIPVGKFALTSALGISPGGCLYTLLGQTLGGIRGAEGGAGRLVLILLLIGLLPLCPLRSTTGGEERAGRGGNNPTLRPPSVASGPHPAKAGILHFTFS
ncbi:MAG TPA: TVP38/TMEM64 family protein [Thermodesulfobacteriota bacterium]|nr:TVP38/TMEM64 family protein [Thermodesulfobacteriota bacterium]